MKARWILVMSALIWLHATTALAFGGLELSPGGARALGRGGAVVARAEDPYVLLHNPASLALIPADRLVLNVDVPVHDMCVKPYGYYGWGVYDGGVSEFGDSREVERDADGEPIIGATYATDPLDRVCNSAPVFATPGIAYNMRFGDLGLGFGFVSPTVLAGLQYGGDDGTIRTADGGRPTPTRYQLIKQEVKFAFAPTVGVGYRVLPRLSVGLSLQWIALGVEQTVVQALNAGTSPHSDMLVKLRARDYFIPGATLAVLATPIDRLDVGFTARIIDTFQGDGDLIYTTSTYQAGATSGFTPYENEDPVTFRDLETGVPWVLMLGARYAHPLPNIEADSRGVAPRGDPLATELFDVELDLGYQLNARSDESSLVVDPGEIVFRRIGEPSEILDVPNPDFDEFNVDRHLQDAVTVRLGGTYNVLPQQLGLSAGVFYESRGVSPDYANIDSFSFARLGLGLGVIARVSRWDFALAYGHVFQETLVVAPPAHQPRQEGSADPASGFDKRVGAPSGAGGPPLEEQNPPKNPDGTAKLRQAAVYQSPTARERVVNAGVYTASFDIVSVTAAYRF